MTEREVDLGLALSLGTMLLFVVELHLILRVLNWPAPVAVAVVLATGALYVVASFWIWES